MHKWNIDDIYRFLISQYKPVMEIELLRHMTGRRRMPADREGLYALHFSLFHALYRLKQDAGGHGLYLHLDPMKIRLIRIPGTGRCHYYFSDTGSYCRRYAGDRSLCDLHAEDPENLKKPLFDPLYEFYINEDNISFGKNGILKKLMNGVILYSLRKGEVQRAIDCFGLQLPNKKSIKKKYRELAQCYHPDRRGGDDAMMKELNSSYQILLEVYAV
jgi:hypothetical protein